MSNPRIYIVISTFLPLVGGAEMQALAQGQGLHERSYETTIITFRHDSSWQSREVIGGVPVIRVAGTLLGKREKLPPLFQRLLYLMALVVMGWKLWRDRRHYDILHLYQLSSLALPAALVSRLTGKPIIIAVRSAASGKAINPYNEASLIAGPLDVTAPWLKVDGHTWAEGDLEGLERMGKSLVRLTRSLLYRSQAVIVVLSTRMKDYLAVHNFNLPHTQLIPNGVDITRFSPTADASISASLSLPLPASNARRQDERAQVVMCVSKLRYEKGIDVLLQAWRLVYEQAPQARLIIVGSGPLQSQLECMAGALGIADSVEFTGLQNDIPSQLHRGKLAVLPSRWEGMPNALLEAMACGSACVATRVSGSEDVIDHGINGLLVEPEDYEDLAQALLTLLRDPALGRQYGQAARVTIAKHYSFEHVLDRYIELYQTITDGRLSAGQAAPDKPLPRLWTDETVGPFRP